MADEVTQAIEGDGYAVGHLDGLGEGYGFRKIRRGLGVTAFGINAIVIPPGYEGGRHFHDEQEETYFVHSGQIEIEFGDGSSHRLGPGAPRGRRRGRAAGAGGRARRRATRTGGDFLPSPPPAPPPERSRFPRAPPGPPDLRERLGASHVSMELGAAGRANWTSRAR